jgi:hypothetical protein
MANFFSWKGSKKAYIEVNDMYYRVRCSKGREHIIAMQQKDMSCGIASVAMVVARCRNLLLEESSLRSYSACFDQGAYRDGTSAYSDTGGTAMFNMEIMLRKMCIPCESVHETNVKTALAKASIKKPIIAHIEWAGSPGIPGGAHFIVIDGMNGANAVVCDPWKDYGFSEINTVPSYNPNGASGRFSGWLLRTT